MPINLLNADPDLGIPALVFVITGLLLLVLALYRLRHKRWFAAAFHSGIAAVFLGCGTTLFLLAANLYTYQRLTYEQPIADIRFTEMDKQRFLAELKTPRTSAPLYFEIYGDEWQLDARILKWYPPATLLGLDARYRLERISGRYSNLEQERNAQHSVYELGTELGMDLWSMLGRLKNYFPCVDAYYGNATYLPMVNNAHYEVSLSQSGLVARAVNTSGKAAIQNWH